jgi:hypothetical protein
MSELVINGFNQGNALQNLLMAEDISPGDAPSYETCKAIYSFHPLGRKIAELPVEVAQSRKRDINIPNSPETMVREAFEMEWNNLNADKHIRNVMTLSRVYGIASIIYGCRDMPTNKDIDPWELWQKEIYFNILDPLNTGGSLVLNQNPNSPDFQKHGAITANGQAYARSKSCVILNESPIYIEYTSSAFGFVGRSVYQRALYPLKSFIQSMVTDNLITYKAGVLVVNMEQAGSVIDKLMSRSSSNKREMLQSSQTGNVLSIGLEDKVESLNLQNSEVALVQARKNILENIAAACPMPAKMINSESFAEGFGEGTEDAKDLIRFINGIRNEMQPLYQYFDSIVQYRAWNPEFYKAVQSEFPNEYGSVSYKEAFYEWKKSFSAEWPSLMEEPESERVKVDEIKMKGTAELLTVILPHLDPENKAKAIEWAQSNLNEQKHMFGTSLNLDFDALSEYTPPAIEAVEKNENVN